MNIIPKYEDEFKGELFDIAMDKVTNDKPLRQNISLEEKKTEKLIGSRDVKNSENLKKLHCLFCQFATNKNNDYQRHLSLHSVKKSFKCPKCGL
ncbi:hypothetical protein Anas_06401 [Armadillidium nasatum]|uniref:C2H2-type domain-containing protein n=1 Tax=Armadillidium nasatum TaxID=96803 RepID=A0A5N5TNI5_9CRUS|nr:hypothetical protein Anas_06401 [Armadillidium nasatum]